MKTLRNLCHDLSLVVVNDFGCDLDRQVDWIGCDWYSMDDDKVYRFDEYGNHPTISRIRVLQANHGTSLLNWEDEDRVCITATLNDGRSLTVIVRKDQEHTYNGDVLWNQLTRTEYCSCGSGLPSHWEYDARNIPLCRVCEKCKVERLSHFRHDVLTDHDYWHDEPIDDE